MPTTKKDKAVLIIFIIVIIGAIIIKIATPIIQKKEEEKQQLERMYYEQNKAFELNSGIIDKNIYNGSDKLDLKDLSVKLFVFNTLNTEYELTVDEVVDYLSEEYDSEGKLRIYSQPESISAYIAWNFNGGRDIEDDFRYQLIDYAKSTTDKKYSEMTYEEVVELLEEYKNSPEYEPPQA